MCPPHPPRSHHPPSPPRAPPVWGGGPPVTAPPPPPPPQGAPVGASPPLPLCPSAPSGTKAVRRSSKGRRLRELAPWPPPPALFFAPLLGSSATHVIFHPPSICKLRVTFSQNSHSRYTISRPCPPFSI